MTTTSPAPSTPKTATACGGDVCQSRDTRPLHHVSHRGNLSYLCTSCVLRCNPGSFCSICFDLFPKSQPHRPLVHCSRCPMISHLSCLPNPGLASHFVCPSCKDSKGFSFFPDGKRKMGDNKVDKVFFVAARLATNSLRLVAVKARQEAEDKARVAVNARKRARELLENAVMLCKKEKEEKEKEEKEKETGGALASAPKAEEMKRKVVRMQNREFEKWVRFHEPIPKVTGVITNGLGLEEKKGKVLGLQNPRLSQPSQGVKSRAPIGFGLEEKEKKAKLLGSPNEGRSVVGGDDKGLRAPQATLVHEEMKSQGESGVEHEDKDKKVKLLGSQNAGGVKEEERHLVESGKKSPRLPQATQDALISRTNHRATFTGSASTASIH